MSPLIDLLPSELAQVNKIYNFAGGGFHRCRRCSRRVKRTILRGTIAINILGAYTKCILSHVMTLTLSLDPIVPKGHGYTWCARVSRLRTERAYAGTTENILLDQFNCCCSILTKDGILRAPLLSF